MYVLRFYGPNDCKAPSFGGLFDSAVAAQHRVDQLVVSWKTDGAAKLPKPVIVAVNR